ncbi:MAG: type II toxin-antitoxin system Phd/YefM family antitoxin [Deltaproteobacteria bacterium]|nr:type II toxin-antitoxin system Phd/YefM family antitoxin [Deltaproteobacteria bacterium]
MENYEQILSVTKVKKHFLNILKQMQEEDATIALTRNGEPVGVLMTPAHYEALLETIEILGNKEITRALELSRQDFKSGRVFTDEEVWGN